MLTRSYKSFRAFLSPARAIATMKWHIWKMPALWVSFRNIEVHVTPGTAVPNRASSLFASFLVSMIRERKARSLLEIGAGSGAIGLACKDETQLGGVTLLDISPCAVESMQKTLLRYPDSAVDVILSDGLNEVKKAYDLIVSNPPHGDAPAHTIYHRRGNDPGWSLHRRLFGEAHRHLTAEGRLVLFENGSPGYSTPEMFASILEGSPLEIERVVYLTPTEYIWYVMVLRVRDSI